MSVARQDPTVTRRYFYSIKDISIGGRCVCNGHANTCSLLDPRAQTRLLACSCQHNTCGIQCEQCCPGFEQKKWRQNTNAWPFQCERKESLIIRFWWCLNSYLAQPVTAMGTLTDVFTLRKLIWEANPWTFKVVTKGAAFAKTVVITPKELTATNARIVSTDPTESIGMRPMYVIIATATISTRLETVLKKPVTVNVVLSSKLRTVIPALKDISAIPTAVLASATWTER